MVLTPYLFSIAMLLCKTLIPVQGGVLDKKKNPANFNKTAADAAISDCGVKLSKRIVGGEEASPGEWRWHVQFAGQGYHCSGSLWLHDGLGEHHLYQQSGTEQEYSISNVISHPQYNFPKYDFALMKMKNSATINDHVGTICLPESATKLPVGTACWETGWGKVSHNGPISQVLKELEVIVVSPNSGPWHVCVMWDTF
ncbi:Serine protease 56 [Desmophyllum pertusum]|uniref:Serine protease 56 n=1 Tax=Desmophyllum pertusum TaxID=174260 RepID=A0A9X0CJC8_9CNID|nr:Serine protease 56 [Desmophyllum pertusum]